MQFYLLNKPIISNKSDFVIYITDEALSISNSIESLGFDLNELKDWMSYNEFTGEYKELLLLPKIPNKLSCKLILIGAGGEKLNKRRSKELFEFIIQTIGRTNYEHCTLCLDGLTRSVCSPKEQVIDIVTKLKLNQYVYTHSGEPNEPLSNRKKVDIISSIIVREKAILEGIALAESINFTKTLGNLPSNICTPSYLSSIASQIADESCLTEVEVLNEEQINEMGMWAFMAVTQGSHLQGNITSIQYKGADTSIPPVLLVGKGITFDTGGISLKARFSLEEMKYDMLGAGAVLGAMKAVIALNLPINLVVMIACAENMPDGKASKPGDVIKSLSGKTIEILDTDAEGRMVLCDTITYGIERFTPDVVIDVATLTGSVTQALGNNISGLFSTNDELSNQLLEASKQADDSIWRLPIAREHGLQLRSQFADIANTGSGRSAGASVAASFISNFVGQTPWAHLDIAGVATHGGKYKEASGRPVSLLVKYLQNYCYSDKHE